MSTLNQKSRGGMFIDLHCSKAERKFENQLYSNLMKDS